MGGELFEYRSGGDMAEALLFEPKAGRPIGQVIVIHEVWGFNTFIREACERLSRHGFRSVAPLLYWRQKALFSPQTIREGLKIVWGLSLEQRHQPARIEAALKKARASGDAASMLLTLYDEGFRNKISGDLRSLARHMRTEWPEARVGAVGFSMGGKLALQLAGDFLQLAASVAYSGEPVFGSTLARIRCPIMLLYGSQDRFMMHNLPRFVGEAAAKGKELTLKSYSSAGHEFFDHTDKKGYRAGAAEDAWKTSTEFLRINLSPRRVQARDTDRKKIGENRAQIRASNPRLCS